MCRACSETPDGGGRHCARPEGFTSVESDQRNRGRNLANANAHLAAGDPQAAANSLARAVTAHRSASGVNMGAPAQDASQRPGPALDFNVSPSDVPRAVARIEQANISRQKVGLPPLGIDVLRSHTPVDGDPIMVMESVAVRIYGAPDSELRAVSVGDDIRTAPERKVSTMAVLRAAAAATRQDGGVYVPRDQGPHCTPNQVMQSILGDPSGAERARLAPTPEDKQAAVKARQWVRAQQSSSPYFASLRHSVAEDYMSLDEVGVASSAFSGYLCHQERVAQMQRDWNENMARERAAQQQPGGAPPVYSPSPQGSRWLSNKGDKVRIKAHIEQVVRIENPHSYEDRVLHVMRTPEGDLVRWMASSPHGLAAGDTMTFSATVKDHSTFNGEKQTEVFYCKDLELHQPNEARQG